MARPRARQTGSTSFADPLLLIQHLGDYQEDSLRRLQYGIEGFSMGSLHRRGLS